MLTKFEHVLNVEHSFVTEAGMFAIADKGIDWKRRLDASHGVGCHVVFGSVVSPQPDFSGFGIRSSEAHNASGQLSVHTAVIDTGRERHRGKTSKSPRRFCEALLRLYVPITFCLSILFTVSAAQAFTLYTTDETGEPLRWFARSAEIQFDDGAPGEVDKATARQAVMESFRRWSPLTCENSDGEFMPEPFTFVDGGYVTQAQVGYDDTLGADNENLVIWVQTGWLHGAEVLALTSLTYDVFTGQIVDADLELNDAKVFSLQPSNQQYDVANTVVHEAGHFLGLDHSAIQIATMFSQALPAETEKRDLTQDDVNGFCALYGPFAAPVTDVQPSQPSSSCTSLPSRAPPEGPTAVLYLIIALASILGSYRWDCSQR